MAQNIYINVNAQSPRNAFVTSEVYPTPVSVYDIVYGDKLALNIYLVDGAGGFDAISGLTGYTILVEVGLLGQSASAQGSTWSAITNGWTGTVDLNTTAIQNLLAGADAVDAWLQVTITDPTGNTRTYGQQQIAIFNQVVTVGPPGPTPTNEHYTKTETNEKFVQNQSAITGLTGGGATNLDGIATVSLGVGVMVAVVTTSNLSHYRLTAGTDAENSPAVVRPDDFDASTNAKVWKRFRESTRRTFSFPSPTNPWNMPHNEGKYPSGVRIIVDLLGVRYQFSGQVTDMDLNNSKIDFNANYAGDAILTFD